MEIETGTPDPSCRMQITSENDDLFLPYVKNRNLEELCDKTSNAKKSKIRKKLYSKFRICNQCPFTTSHSGDFNRHLRKHSDPRFACPECNMPFNSMGHLNSHRRSEHQIETLPCEKIWKCESCDYITRHSSDRTKHIRRHESAPLNCRYCNRPFFFQNMLDRHLSRMHGNVNEPSEKIQNADVAATQKEIKSDDKINKINKSAARKNNDEIVSVDSKGNKYGSSVYSVGENVIETQNQTVSIKEVSRNIKWDRKKNSVDGTSFDSAAETDNLISDKVRKLNKNVINLRRVRSEAKRRKCNAKKAHNKSQECIDRSNTNTMKCSTKIEIAAKPRRITPDDNNNAEIPSSERIYCAFCRYKANSYYELQDHLDKHDIDEMSDISNNDIEDTGKEIFLSDCDNKESGSLKTGFQSNVSNNSDANGKALFHENSNTSENVFDLRKNASNIADDLALSDTDSEVSDEEAADNSDVEIQNNMDASDEIIVKDDAYLDKADMDNSAERYDLKSDDEEMNEGESEEEVEHIDAEEFVDAIALWNGFVTSIKSRTNGSFREQPFACSKCLYTTNNQDYLKIHADAHLYERRRLNTHETNDTA